MLDAEVRERFKEFQKKTGKHKDLDIDEVRFESKNVQKIFDSIRRGASPRPIKDFIVDNNFSGKKYNWLKIGDVTKSNIYLNKTSQYIDEKGKAKSVLGKKGDFLITNSMTVGVPVILNIDTCFHDGFLHLGFNDDEQRNYYNLYLYYYFTSYREKLILKSKDGIVKNLNIDIMKEVNVPIPIDLDKVYTSFEIQEAIVEFLEFWKDGYTDVVRERVFKKKPIYKAIKKLVVKNTFKYDKFLIENFNKFVKNKGYDFNLKDIEFEKKYLKTLVSTPVKGGGTPDTKVQKYWHNDFLLIDNVNYFGWRNIEKKLFNKKTISEYSKVISKKGFESSSTWLIPKNSILIAIASASKGLIVINDKPMCTNQNILGVVINEKNSTEYIYYFLENIYRYLDGKKEFGNLTKGSEENREVLIPKGLNDCSSKEIQLLLVEFWEMIIVSIDKKLAIYKRMLELTDIIDRAFLYRTFSKIDWSKE